MAGGITTLGCSGSGWGYDYTWLFREWLGCLVKILFRSPWRTRQLAAKSIKTVVGTRPILAEHLLDILTDIVNKVSVFVFVVMCECGVCV